MAYLLSSAPFCSRVFSALSSSPSSSSSSKVSSSAHRRTEIFPPALPPYPPSSTDCSDYTNTEYRRRLSNVSLPITAAACCLFTLASSSHDSASASVSFSAQVASSVIDDWMSREPPNALSLPTWSIHVASVVEWVIAMALVWEYGDTPGNSAWKGLSWGMVPLLGGAMCACTWHFFYNAPSLEILVVLQAGLTFLGNFTMWIAAYRIYQSSEKKKLEK